MIHGTKEQKMDGWMNRWMDERKMIVRECEDGMRWLYRYYNNENDDILMIGDEKGIIIELDY